MLQDRINKITEYFRGMEIANNVLIVRVEYKSKWGVFPSEDENIKVCKSEEIPNEYFYYGDYSYVSIDEIFDLIEETIEMNISAEMKVNLLTEKIEELKVMFTNEPLEKLRTLCFVFNEDKIQPKKKNNRKPKKAKKEEEITETVSNETVETKEAE